MTTLTYEHPVTAAVPATLGPIPRLLGWLACLPRRHADWHDNRQAMRRLMAMDAHELKDLGISRSEIQAAVEGRYTPRRQSPLE